MAYDQLVNPAILFLLVVLALGFVPFRIWWAILRVLLAPILRPVIFLLLASAAAAAAVLHFGG